MYVGVRTQKHPAQDLNQKLFPQRTFLLWQHEEFALVSENFKQRNTRKSKLRSKYFRTHPEIFPHPVYRAKLRLNQSEECANIHNCQQNLFVCFCTDFVINKMKTSVTWFGSTSVLVPHCGVSISQRTPIWSPFWYFFKVIPKTETAESLQNMGFKWMHMQIHFSEELLSITTNRNEKWWNWTASEKDNFTHPADEQDEGQVNFQRVKIHVAWPRKLSFASVLSTERFCVPKMAVICFKSNSAVLNFGVKCCCKNSSFDWSYLDMDKPIWYCCLNSKNVPKENKNSCSSWSCCGAALAEVWPCDRDLFQAYEYFMQESENPCLNLLIPMLWAFHEKKTHPTHIRRNDLSSTHWCLSDCVRWGFWFAKKYWAVRSLRKLSRLIETGVATVLCFHFWIKLMTIGQRERFKPGIVRRPLPTWSLPPFARLRLKRYEEAFHHGSISVHAHILRKYKKNDFYVPINVVMQWAGGAVFVCCFIDEVGPDLRKRARKSGSGLSKATEGEKKIFTSSQNLTEQPSVCGYRCNYFLRRWPKCILVGVTQFSFKEERCSGFSRRKQESSAKRPVI